MPTDLERVLQGLEEARAFAASYRFEITPEYRALIARVEELPQNQSGADKSGRWLGSQADQRAWRARVTPRPVR
ncbi:MAG: hypothetical protein HYU37_05610 [Acidobacteria bacterium]|nr:hypothetical protein [Acidobacteriota bacterium]